MKWVPPEAWVPPQGQPHLGPLLLLLQHLQLHQLRSRQPMRAGRRAKGTRRGSSRHSRPSKRLLLSAASTLQRITLLQVISDLF